MRGRRGPRSVATSIGGRPSPALLGRPRRPLLALGLSLLLLAPLWGESEYWNSDEAGFPIARLAAPPAAPEADRWWLEIRREGSREIRRIFRGSEEKERIEVGPGPLSGHRLERSWKGKVLVDELEYGAGGELLRESSWSQEGAGLLWTESYGYRDGRLSELRRTDAAGAELGSILYRYDPSGRLLSIELSGYYGSAELGGVAGPVLPRALWSRSGEGLSRIELFNPSGSVASVLEFQGDKSLSSRRFLYDEGGVLLSDRQEDADGLLTLSTYGRDGRLLSLVKEKDGARVEEHEYVWDKEGRLLSDDQLLPRPSLRVVNGWDDQGKLVKVERYVEGQLVLRTSYEPGDVRIEETWADGQIVVRTRYEGGIKVREDFLKDGLVLRSRVYP